MTEDDTTPSQESRAPSPKPSQALTLTQSLFHLSSSMPAVPQSCESVLTLRYIHIFSSQALDQNPFSMLGSWIASIPERMGFDPTTLDLAVEFAVNAFLRFRDAGWETERMIRASRARALKSLFGALGEQAGNRNGNGNGNGAVVGTGMAKYNLCLATKLHMAAEVGMASCYRVIHINGLNDILRLGSAEVVDEQHFWDLVDDAYAEEVGEALITGRVYPYGLRQRDLSDVDVASHAIHVQTTALSVCTRLETDIIPTSLGFDSIQTLVLVSKYYMARNQLCGLLRTLLTKFPLEYLNALLPGMAEIRYVDIEAAVKIAQSLPYAWSVNPHMPLVPLRIIQGISYSMAPWHRVVHELSASEGVDANSEMDAAGLHLNLQRAKMMQDWAVEQGNKIHDVWNIERADSHMLQTACDIMVGKEIPGWFPRRVRFEEVGDEMVIKLEYGG
ncbi:hypothetical protein K504DRAFT_503327 [Pleomassaria siparia CBS 279.74]|uniref:Uncharacterized protein n=1 Tax=Pleomassaria siparia CBS 279.74 TaxID=1314801 RepID=A0A6G1K6P8_9PLEO|nr:hypothetical protein K504DRAFT_503327 [Pleomassaria siparia CBS 279.74]